MSYENWKNKAQGFQTVELGKMRDEGLLDFHKSHV